jgi:hypothetical protein
MVPLMTEKLMNIVLIFDFDIRGFFVLEIYHQLLLTSATFHLPISAVLTQKLTFGLFHCTIHSPVRTKLTDINLRASVQRLLINLTPSLLEETELAQPACEEGHEILVCWKEANVFQIEPNTTCRNYKESSHMSLIDHPIS